MRFWIVTIMLLLTTGLLQAQEQTPYEIALERILEAERTGATILYLAQLRLTELPPEIGNLVNLQSLNLSNNELSNLPPEIGNLNNLVYFNLNNSQLSSLPVEIGNLTNLRELHL